MTGNLPGKLLSVLLAALVFLLCLAGITIDVTSYFVTQSSVGSVYTLFAFLIVVIGAGAHTLREYMTQQKRIEEQEKELTENRDAIMMSQIQPHFMYNSLAAIYYLCDEDPHLAKQAIDQFSSYLRVNMDSLKQTKNIPFADELKHIRNYLSLEKMRYDDRLSIFYNIETTDFLVPALSIQPIVENAVRHGISKQPEGGTLIISAYEKDGWYEIIVEDDGVGFDPEKGSDDKSRSHIGIENVRYRLREMCGGTLEITSEIGFGTTAVIRIPGSAGLRGGTGEEEARSFCLFPPCLPSSETSVFAKAMLRGRKLSVSNPPWSSKRMVSWRGLLKCLSRCGLFIANELFINGAKIYAMFNYFDPIAHYKRLMVGTKQPDIRIKMMISKSNNDMHGKIARPLRYPCVSQVNRIQRLLKLPYAFIMDIRISHHPITLPNIP